jgi:predicted nucleic acid-binding protein
MTFVGIDTNILVYAARIRRAASDTEKIEASRALLSSFKEGVTVVVSTQTWGELFAVLTRTGMARADASATIGDLRTAISSAPAVHCCFSKICKMGPKSATY